MESFSIGYISSTHGLDGYVRVQSFSGEYLHFEDLTKIVLKKDDVEQEFDVEDVKISSSLLRIKFKGINTPEEAKKYVSYEVVVPRDKACPLKEDEWYVEDLCKCVLVCDGISCGTVTGVVKGGGGDLLDVSLVDGSKVFVPLKEEFIGKVDTLQKTIELKHRWILE